MIVYRSYPLSGFLCKNKQKQNKRIKLMIPRILVMCASINSLTNSLIGINNSPKIPISSQPNRFTSDVAAFDNWTQ